MFLTRNTKGDFSCPNITSQRQAVDVWSVGCIFAEIITRKPFFQGKNPQHQLSLIVEVVGCPPASELDFASHIPVARDIIERARDKHQEAGRKSTSTSGRGSTGRLRNRLPSGASPEALDLLSKMLVVKPEDRLTVEQALEHPYLKDLHSQMEEPSCIHPFDGSFEEPITPKGCSLDDNIRRMMIEEMEKLQQGAATSHQEITNAKTASTSASS
uniref:Protein kinase domain-containing protein n=1 Tax=Odontella aurita TaxID=265563 RepID=A0A7S4KBV7_9STRA|mmetsp:Transcript_9016/g.26932  ORF Transcript_9016/g.26932 Transcript_9016/m.26932 type:complete len:214 (+) Transcript_9016:1060-1701(+)